MNKILSIEKAIKKSEELRKRGKKIVLVGGCFDILHVGHITFLENARKEGDVLFVLLESDENIKKIKGANRPINAQVDRANILSHLDVVDYVIKIPPIKNDNDYDGLVILLKPAIIATTKGDPMRVHKERQAGQIGAKVVDVIEPVINQSTTRLISILNEL